MVSQFSVFGMCISRNIFMDELNKGYKSFFNINHSIEGISIISLMSDPIEFDEALINSDDEFVNLCIKEDLTKNYINTIKTAKLDYILIDTLYDADEPIIKYDENSYISDSFRFKMCDFRNQVKDKPRLTISDNFEEFMKLWETAYNQFFELVQKNRYNPRVILNCARASYTYQNEGSLVEHPDFKRRSLRINRNMDVMDKKLLETYDIDVLPFDYSTLIDLNHIFSPSIAHYEKPYYSTKSDQLKKIVARYDHLDYDDEINVEFRRLARENIIKDINIRQLKEKNELLKLKSDSPYEVPDSKSNSSSMRLNIANKFRNLKKRK